MANKKAILIIMDGVGLRADTFGNAVAQAHKPTLDMLMQKYPHAQLQASEAAVGLPKGQMGNSEVGHLNIGAGRVIYTGLSLINKDLDTGDFYKNQAFLAAIQHAKKNHGRLHIMGLCSNGGVHSNIEHIYALLKLSHIHDVKTVVHCFGDGRDVDPRALLQDIKPLLKVIKENNAILGTIAGRYYAMDRDKRWDRVQLAYDTMLGNGSKQFTDVEQYINEMYQNNVTDEFLLPAINGSCAKTDITIQDHDAVIFANFRPDRARELSHLIYGSTYYDYTPLVRRHDLFFVTMMTYEGIVPSAVAYPTLEVKNTLGEIIAKANLKQLRIAETEKYAHVTFFFDGGKEINYPNETKIIIPSPKVATYDLQPEMSAGEVCDQLLKHMANEDVIICNFANGDMVGHTGSMPATIKAVETIDTCIGKIFAEAQKLNATLFVTADHGNADELLDKNNNVITSHSLSPVPFIVTDADIKLNDRGVLANIAPTILDYLDIKKPAEMIDSLIKH
ncbi:MAG: 2,3-bisphosphoglycerate-independent phosphoglycerate mutase [Mycoplasmataceae bacterium]|jgi:2,3-bisphosphoglycerate-independent phosphoglycerate mutase|nr:2,3-bisphosphoglycerate-independent phosphoglycerate mutase [Mycoplasmataceae bacterium]